MVSIPIPEDEHKFALPYTALHYKRDKKLVDLMETLGKDSYEYKGAVTKFRKGRAHIDPDLRRVTLPRRKGWKAVFGQSGKDQTILHENHVGQDDLFLFFGTFSKTFIDGKKTKFDRHHKKQHVIFGYLQVGNVLDVNKDEVPKWLDYFSHARLKGEPGWENNTVYISRDQLSFLPQFPGAGVFRFDDEREKNHKTKLTLTKPGESKSKWELPFGKCKIRWHAYSSSAQNPWCKGYFKSPDIGQEMIIEEREDVKEWAVNLIRSHRVDD
jgi:hypothetical protein